MERPHESKCFCSQCLQVDIANLEDENDRLIALLAESILAIDGLTGYSEFIYDWIYPDYDKWELIAAALLPRLKAATEEK